MSYERVQSTVAVGDWKSVWRVEFGNQDWFTGMDNVSAVPGHTAVFVMWISLHLSGCRQ